MSTADAIILLASGILALAVIAVATVALIETSRPPIKGRLEDIIEAASRKKKGPCP